MKVKFEYEGYWGLSDFQSNLECFENSAQDCGVWISGPIKLIPDDDPGPGFERPTLVLIPCEFEFSETYELTSMIVEIMGTGPADFTLDPQIDEDSTVFFNLKMH